MSITCGDIRTNETYIENQFSKWFKLAEIWGAIMLLDEAGIYLEQRQTADVKRNSLVSGESIASSTTWSPIPHTSYSNRKRLSLEDRSLSPFHGILSRDPVPHQKSGWSLRRRLHLAHPRHHPLREARAGRSREDLAAIFREAEEGA
jgi:hypothetical protein